MKQTLSVEQSRLFMNKQNIYVTGAEQGSGKSIIMLAMMDMLSGYAGKIGFFRPHKIVGQE